MMYNSEVKNTFNQSTVQQDQPCTFEAGQIANNHILHSMSANQVNNRLINDVVEDNSDRITVEDFYPIIDPKIKNQIAMKVRMELRNEVKAEVTAELT